MKKINRESLPHRGSIRKRMRNPVQYRARYLLNNAIAKGAIKKMPCVVCGEKKSQGHHKDYSAPLDVIWLCDKHHKEEHARMKS